MLSQADVVIYAGSLVNPDLLSYVKEGCEIHNSAGMTLEETFSVICQAEQAGKMTVRLHTGDPSLYGAIGEQMALLRQEGIFFDVTAGGQLLLRGGGGAARRIYPARRLSDRW